MDEWPDDPWGDAPSLRDVATIKARLVGTVVSAPDDALVFSVSFPDDIRAERAANAYLTELADTFARPLTLRSYAFDILRWLRFLGAVGVAFDEAVRSDYTDFRRWLIDHGKTGGARRAPSARPSGARMNRITGKSAPHESQFDPATIRHSRVVLHEWYEFLRDRGLRPIVNPIPNSRRSDRDGRRRDAHHNPLEPFSHGGGRRVDPPSPDTTPSHLTDVQFDAVWAELTCDRDRAMVKVSVDCGIRPGELVAMRGEDVDWGNALVHVVRKGGRKSQWLPVSGDAVVWLRRYQAESSYVAGLDEPVWVALRGVRRAVGYDAYRAMFARVNARLATNWTPHDLRHTACVRMLDAGMDLHKVQEIMGHAHLSTTERYVRPRLDEIIAAQREAQARPQPRPPVASPYDQSDLDDLFGSSRR
ncbi:MAG: tyrosine-type recombinase/integrase [Anaerolineales bacterium]